MVKKNKVILMVIPKYGTENRSFWNRFFPELWYFNFTDKCSEDIIKNEKEYNSIIAVSPFEYLYFHYDDDEISKVVVYVDKGYTDEMKEITRKFMGKVPVKFKLLNGTLNDKTLMGYYKND